MQRFLSSMCISLALGGQALAQTWNENGDAPPLPPGQPTNGAGPLMQIVGALSPTSDVDLYAIRIDSPGAFSATTEGGATFDTQLFLFDSNGRGVTHNDDSPTGGNQSRITGQFVPGPGIYLLAISPYNRDPVNAVNQLLWINAPFNVERAPDGPGRLDPIANWTGSGPAGAYTIHLTAASFSGQSGTGACCFGTFCEIMPASACQANGGAYQGDGSTCMPSNPCCPPPVILEHPQWQPARKGQTVVFHAQATAGPMPVTYQWFHAGELVPGGNQPQLVIPNAQEPDFGPYYVVASSGCGSTRSHSADLTVYEGCAPPIANPGNCWIPDVWKIDPVPWNRDVAPQNKIDDLIDANPGIRHDIIVDFRACVTPGHVAFLENISPQSSVTEVFEVITCVTMSNVSRAEMLTIAGHLDVALVEKNVSIVALLDTSMQTVKVAGPYYDPDTVATTFGYTGDGFNIAIVDTGVDDTVHDTFTVDPAIFVAGYDTFLNAEINPDDDHYHGTHVASIALGRGGAFVSPGVAPKAGLIDVKVLNAAGSGTIQGVMRGLQKLIDRQRAWNVHIINMSLGGPDSTNGVESFSQLTDRCVAQGMIVVVAAGNSYPSQVNMAPARAARALTVAASNDLNTPDRVDDVIAPFSQTGPAINNGNSDVYDELKPEVTAPGFAIVAAANNSASGTRSLSGTSMASPHVAGIAALCLQAKPSLNPESFKAAMINTAERRGLPGAAGVGLSPTGWNERWGWGLVDAFAAISQMTGGPTDVAVALIGPVNFPPRCGVSNTLFANVGNIGGAMASNVRVDFGVFNFNAGSPPFIHIGTAVIPMLLPGQTVQATVPWIPNCTTLSAHQCLKVEVGCDNEADPTNNSAQRNMDITNSPVYFEVSNYVSRNPVTITFVAQYENPASGWGVQITPPSVTLGPDDLPVTVEVLPLPLEPSPDGATQILHVESQTTDGTCLGGVEIICRVKDCNGNGRDDWFDIRDGISQDINHSGIPDECECIGDLNGDHGIDINDLARLLGHFGSGSGATAADGDIDGDGDVDLNDLAIMLGRFGRTCP